MDSKFPDRMAEVGQVDSETLNQRWGAAVRVADNADSHAKARLVLIASRDPIDRDLDRWFWEPFRAVEDTFRIDDAVELHARLAEASARRVIEDGDALVPMLVRLAQMGGRTFATTDLVTDAIAALIDHPTAIPAAPTFKNYYTKTVQTALKPDAAPDAATVAGHLSDVAASSQTALVDLFQHVAALTGWARDAEERFSTGQRLIEWLLAGVRADGTPWSELSHAAIAVDAAAELSNFVSGAPGKRHEAILAQVLAVARVDESPVEATAEGVQADLVTVDSAALMALTPMTSSLAAGRNVDALPPSELSLRVLWEMATRRTWAEE